MARKLGVSQAEIVRYLTENNMPVEEGSNVKLEEVHVRLLYARYAPHENASPVSALFPDSPLPIVSGKGVDELVLSPVNDEVANDEVPVHEVAEVKAEKTDAVKPEMSENGEIIRAPRIELAGLKVLGKIELRDPKKKEVNEAASEENSSADRRGQTSVSDGSSPRRPRGRQSRDRQEKNPVAAQREREMAEERERRKKKAEEEKERRTQNYHKRVKHSPPTKAVRLIEEPVEELTEITDKGEPTSWFGKFVKWFKS